MGIGPLEGVLIFIIAIVILILPFAIKILREYERAVKFRLGRFAGIKGPGLFLIIPGIEKIMKVDLRTITLDVPKQRVVTKDNVSVNVDAVVYMRVVNPSDAIMKVEHYIMATSLLAQTTLRDVLGQSELDELLSKRDELNARLQKILDEATDVWGIKVSSVTIRDVSLPEEMLRAIAKQAEAERERRSRVIMAQGEFEAAKRMTEAAKQYEENPAALRLRELQTLTEIAREKNLIVVTPTQVGTQLGEVAGLTAALRKAKEK
ncbi:MAG: slipin family protein [Candidatus Hodarchaeaceae archaeon]|nr:slipin family protein [Candidatus Hodarchaeaceae archaeon]